MAREGHNAGLERRVHPHMLRHTFATELLSEGFDIRQVQELLGHANLHTTQIYTHVNLGELKEKVKQRGKSPALRQAQDAAEADAVQQLAAALANLPQEQRQALAAAAVHWTNWKANSFAERMRIRIFMGRPASLHQGHCATRPPAPRRCGLPKQPRIPRSLVSADHSRLVALPRLRPWRCSLC